MMLNYFFVNKNQYLDPPSKRKRKLTALNYPSKWQQHFSNALEWKRNGSQAQASITKKVTFEITACISDLTSTAVSDICGTQPIMLIVVDFTVRTIILA